MFMFRGDKISNSPIKDAMSLQKHMLSELEKKVAISLVRFRYTDIFCI